MLKRGSSDWLFDGVVDNVEPSLNEATLASGDIVIEGKNCHKARSEPKNHPVSIDCNQPIDSCMVAVKSQRRQEVTPSKCGGKRKWKKPKDKPKRPLSAYNLFFQTERLQLLADCSSNDSSESSLPIETTPGDSQNGKKAKRNNSGLAGLTRHVATKWNTLDGETRSKYEMLAKLELLKYAKAMEEWKKKKSQEIQDECFNDSLDSTLKASRMLITTDPDLEMKNAGHIQANADRNDWQHAPLQTFATSLTSLSHSSESCDLPNRSELGGNQECTEDSLLRLRQNFQHDESLARIAAYVAGTIDQSEIFSEAATNRYIDPKSLSLLLSQLDEDEQDCLVSLRDA